MQKVAYSRRVRPDVRCVNPGDSKEACIEAIRAGRADVISLDAGDLYAASRSVHNSLLNERLATYMHLQTQFA